MNIHLLKTETKYFERTVRGDKPFEVRFNDRSFKEGDFVILCEWLPDYRDFTGRRAEGIITYITAMGMAEGWVVFALENINIKVIP